MNNKKTENLIKAAQSATFMDDEIRAAYRDAVGNGNECAAELLMDLMEPAIKLRRKLSRILEAVGLDNNG
jgi:acetyl-CoA carboxylase carboxyltransferase component